MVKNVVENYVNLGQLDNKLDDIKFQTEGKISFIGIAATYICQHLIIKKYLKLNE